MNWSVYSPIQSTYNDQKCSNAEQVGQAMVESFSHMLIMM